MRMRDVLALTRHGDGRAEGSCVACLPEELRQEIAAMSLAADLERAAQARLAAQGRTPGPGR